MGSWHDWKNCRKFGETDIVLCKDGNCLPVDRFGFDKCRDKRKHDCDCDKRRRDFDFDFDRKRRDFDFDRKHHDRFNHGRKGCCDHNW